MSDARMIMEVGEGTEEDRKYESAVNAVLHMSKKDYPSYVGGLAVASGHDFPVWSPIDETIIFGSFQEPEDGLTDRAVEVAKKAFATWSKTSPEERVGIFDRALENIVLQKYKLAGMATVCCGMTRDEALEQLPSIEQAVDSLRAIGLVEKGLNRSWLMPSLSKQQERLDAWQAYFTPAKRKQVWHTICAECNRLSIDPSLFDNFQELMANPAEPELIVETDILPPEVLENFVEQKSGLYLVYFSVKNLPENTLAVNDCLTKVDGCMLMNPYYYCKNLVELIHDDFNLIMWISMGFVLLLLLITYRNIWLTLIALLPMLLSWYTVLGAMALFGQTFNLVNIIVSSFVFGIGVDYSVFIMEGLRKGDDDNPTMVYNKTAITMSATILVICMFVLGFAVHPAVSSISFASTVGMITTIMLSYTIEPILYRFYMKIKNRKKKVKV